MDTEDLPNAICALEKDREPAPPVTVTNTESAGPVMVKEEKPASPVTALVFSEMNTP